MRFLFRAAVRLVRRGFNRHSIGNDARTQNPASFAGYPEMESSLDHVQVDCSDVIIVVDASAMPRVRRYGDNA